MRSCDIENNINGVYYILIYISWIWFDKTLSRDIYPFVGQPIIVRSHSKVHRSRGNPKEIPTWASRVSTSLDSTDNKHGVQRQVRRRCKRRRNFIYYIEYFRKAAGILLLDIWCKNIRYNIPIITLVGVWLDGLSPLEKVGHPRAALLFSGRQTVGWHSNKGDNCMISPCI